MREISDNRYMAYPHERAFVKRMHAKQLAQFKKLFGQKTQIPAEEYLKIMQQHKKFTNDNYAGAEF
jgi:hypothetical protein